jgi:hypothetical protein
MFFNPPRGWTATLVRLDDRFGSDHYPLLGWLRFSGQPHLLRTAIE